MGQERRLAVLRLLMAHGSSGLSAGELTDQVGMGASTTSFHRLAGGAGHAAQRAMVAFTAASPPSPTCRSRNSTAWRCAPGSMKSARDGRDAGQGAWRLTMRVGINGMGRIGRLALRAGFGAMALLNGSAIVPGHYFHVSMTLTRLEIALSVDEEGVIGLIGAVCPRCRIKEAEARRRRGRDIYRRPRDTRSAPPAALDNGATIEGAPPGPRRSECQPTRAYNNRRLRHYPSQRRQSSSLSGGEYPELLAGENTDPAPQRRKRTSLMYGLESRLTAVTTQMNVCSCI